MSRYTMTESATIDKPLPLGARLRTARKERRITVAKLARELGVDTRTVARWQSGESTPSIERLTEIARLLDRPPSYFLDEEEDA